MQLLLQKKFTEEALMINVYLKFYKVPFIYITPVIGKSRQQLYVPMNPCQMGQTEALLLPEDINFRTGRGNYWEGTGAATN